MLRSLMLARATLLLAGVPAMTEPVAICKISSEAKVFAVECGANVEPAR